MLVYVGLSCILIISLYVLTVKLILMFKLNEQTSEQKNLHAFNINQLINQFSVCSLILM